jgi:hypothetical protein
MSKRILWLVTPLLTLMVSVWVTVAGEGQGDLFILSYNITCSSATVTYEATSSGGLDFAEVTVENLTSGQIIATVSEADVFGDTVTLTYPPQPVGSVLMITVSSFMTVSTAPEACTGETETNTGDPAQPPRCADGRLNYNDCEPLAIYPVNDEGSYGVQVYIVEAEDKGMGRFGFFVFSADLDALPDNPETPILVAESEDGFVRLFKLPSGELQFVGGPDYEGKYFVFRFTDFPTTYPQVSTFTLTAMG